MCSRGALALLADMVEDDRVVGQPSRSLPDGPPGLAVLSAIAALISTCKGPTGLLNDPRQHSLKGPGSRGSRILYQVVAAGLVNLLGQPRHKVKHSLADCPSQSCPVLVWVEVRQDRPDAAVERDDGEVGAVLPHHIPDHIPASLREQVVPVEPVSWLTACPGVLLRSGPRHAKGPAERLEHKGAAEAIGSPLLRHAVLSPKGSLGTKVSAIMGTFCSK